MNFSRKLIQCLTFSGLLLTAFSIAGCNTEDFVSLLVDKDVNSTSLNKASWKSEPKGYISSAEPATSNVEYLIRLARVSAAVISYSKFASESREAKTPIMEILWKIEAVSSVNLDTQLLYSSITPNLEKRNIQSIKSELIKLAKPESILALTNDDYEKRYEKRQIQDMLDSIEYRLGNDAYETASVHDVLLASSALLREAGNLMEQAVSAEGQIQDEVLFVKAMALVEATKAVKPASNFTYCDEEISRTKQVQDGIDQLESKLKMVRESAKSSVKTNAGDLYKLAGIAEQAGNEKQIVQSCSKPLYLSQTY